MGDCGSADGGCDGKSPKFHHCAKPRLAPLTWFDRATVHKGNGRGDPKHVGLHGMVMSHMAGVPKESRPSARQLYDAFHTKRPDAMQRFWLYSVLSCATMLELRRTMHSEGLSLRTVVRALHNSGVLRHDQCRWAMPGRGKRGGSRVIYYWQTEQNHLPDDRVRQRCQGRSDGG